MAHGIAIFQSPKNIFSEPEICRKNAANPQKERFSTNFRHRILKFQSPPCKSAERAIFSKFQAPNLEISEPEKIYAVPYPQPFHAPTGLPPSLVWVWFPGWWSPIGIGVHARSCVAVFAKGFYGSEVTYANVEQVWLPKGPPRGPCETS